MDGNKVLFNKSKILKLLCLALLLCYASFLLSFFPMRKPVPGYASHRALPEWLLRGAGNDSKAHHQAPRPVVGRVVIVVIDALRVDFIFHENTTMKYLKSLTQKSEALGYVARAHPPTVTLPRIKAITSGTIPGFIDVISNFDTDVFSEDNVVIQMKKMGKKIIFYGDDTWTSLFPNHFLRSEGTSSFFVTDYTEVDDNVTRHLSKELEQDDWDVMILHYLGLDHIGHLSGPSSPLIGPKLQEMDNVIQKIYSALNRKKEILPTLLIVCGDHGMSDQGSHGGASSSETLVPVLFISQAWKSMIAEIKDGSIVQQIDLAPTLSILLGLPIPQNSLGCILKGPLINYSIEEKAQAFWVNSQQVLNIFEYNVPDYENDLCYIQCHIAFSHHSDWLQKLRTELFHSTWEEEGYQLIQEYEDCLRTMSSKIASSLTKYHMYGITVSVFLLCMILIVVILTALQKKRSNIHFHHLPLVGLCTIVVIFGHVTICTGQTNNMDLICQKNPQSVLLQACLLACFFFLAICVADLILMSSFDSIKKPRNVVSHFLILGTVLHTLSFLSSSFVEEEHQTWYFYTVSIHILILSHFISQLHQKKTEKPNCVQTDKYTALNQSKNLCVENQSNFQIQQHSYTKRNSIEETKTYRFNLRNVTSHSNTIDRTCSPLTDQSVGVSDYFEENCSDRGGIVKLIVSVLCMLILSRVARSWNQTGNKWLARPDIGDWLNRPENKLPLSAIVALSLLLLIPARWKSKSHTTNFLFTTACMAIYKFRLATGSVYFPGLDFLQDKGLHEAWFVYITVLTLVIHGIWKKWREPRGSLGSPILGDSLQSACTLLMALLFRPHNIPLVAIVTYQEHLIHYFLPHCKLSLTSASLYFWWLGQTTFFYQGNSNSISTVDVSAGYIGVLEYQPLVIGTLLALSTYIGPIFWFFNLLKYVCQHQYSAIGDRRNDAERSQCSMETVCTSLLISRTFTLAIYTALVTSQRYHLFVWTVFSPKLLYEGCLTIATALFCIVILYIKK